MSSIHYFLSPEFTSFVHEKAKVYGPITSGALFGAGWWFWVDGVVGSSAAPFVQWLPGIVATLALIMINSVRREDMLDYDAFDDQSICRSRLWLFLCYVVSFAAVISSVWILLTDYGPKSGGGSGGSSSWLGVAGLFQVVLILASGLLFWVARSPGDGSSYYSYSAF